MLRGYVEWLISERQKMVESDWDLRWMIECDSGWEIMMKMIEWFRGWRWLIYWWWEWEVMNSMLYRLLELGVSEILLRFNCSAL